MYDLFFSSGKTLVARFCTFLVHQCRLFCMVTMQSYNNLNVIEPYFYTTK